MYKQTDKYLKRLKQELAREYRKLSLMPFDQLHVLRVKKETKTLFSKVDEMNRKNYTKICDYVEWWAIYEFFKDRDDLDEAIKPKSQRVVDKVIKSYNPTTGYRYAPEWERKRLRAVEELMTAISLNDFLRYQKACKKTIDLMYTQSMQYAIDCADEMEEEVMEWAGEKHVIWRAEKDDRTCTVCKERDGIRYRIREVPPKPHYNCRCWLEPGD